MPFVMAQLQLRWGNDSLNRYTRAFARLKPIFEEAGVVLRHSLVSQYGGHLYEIWNLWEVTDANHMDRARTHLRTQEAYHLAHAELTEVVSMENLRYLHELPIEG